MTSIAHRIALITGGGSGIGQATAVRMAAEGATVAVADINLEAAVSTATWITDAGNRAHALELDVADDNAWRIAIDEIMNRHKRLDILVNNAGVSKSNPVSDLTYADWRRVMAVNLDGVFLGTKHAIRVMKPGGSIVNVASVSGIKPGAGAAAYCASKAAVRIFSRAVAIECADSHSGIRVNVVSPGGVKTPMWEREQFFQDLVDEQGSTELAFEAIGGDLPSGQFFSADEVAATILYLASDAAEHLAGTEIILDRGHSG